MSHKPDINTSPFTKMAEKYEDIPLEQVHDYLQEEFFPNYTCVAQKTPYGQRHIILARNLVARKLFHLLDAVLGYRIKLGIYTDFDEFVPAHAFETHDENLSFNAISLFLSDKPQRNLKLLARQHETLAHRIRQAKNLEPMEDTLLINEWFAQYTPLLKQYAAKQILARTFQANDAVWGDFIVFNAIMQAQKLVDFETEAAAQIFADRINDFVSHVSERPFTHARVYEQKGMIIVGIKAKKAKKIVKRLKRAYPKDLLVESQDWQEEFATHGITHHP